MVWFKVDDKFHASAPVKMIPLSRRAAAVGLWTLAGAWSADHLKNGYVPAYMIEDFGGSDELVDELVRVGLWRRRRDGVQFSDWAKWQRTREVVEASRKAERDRKAAWRAERAAKSGDGPGGVPVGHSPRPLLPDPTRTIPIKNSSSPGGEVALEVPASFDEWWALYPRKVGKEAARKAFVRASAKVAPSVLVEAAQRFSRDPNLPEKKFIPHPSTWLNEGRWDDEPLPGEGGPAPLVLVPPLSDREREQREWLSARGISWEEYLERKDEPGWFDSVKRKGKEIAHA